MKQGKTLVELATEVQRQAEAKQDFVAPVGKISMVRTLGKALQEGDPFDVGLALQGAGHFAVRPLAHGQLAEYAGIPKAYYDTMLAKAPALLADNVNHWLHAANGDKRLVRVLDGNVRGILSDRYRPLDNFDLASAVLPVLQQENLEIVSCEITERKLYIKAFNAAVAADIRRNGGNNVYAHDVCSPVICISNSEVGFGALSITAGIFTKGCTNLAFFSDSSMKKYHVGKGVGDIDAIQAVLSDKTKSLTDAAIWAQCRDIVKSAFNEVRFNELIGRVQETTEQRIEGDVVKVVNLTAERLGFTKSEGSSVLRHLIEGGDLSRYGLFNAVTRAAEDIVDYDRATEFERAGGKVIELPRNDWEVLAKAA